MRMKMSFFSSDNIEMEKLTRTFMDAGIPCDVRKAGGSTSGRGIQAELWVQDDRDRRRALTLFEQRNI